jgi:hypothetical protein
MLGGAALTVGAVVALATSPASATIKFARQRAAEQTERVNKDPFGDIPKGPLQIVISIDQQKLHLYSDGKRVADSSVATGVPSLPTPLGVFSVIQKQRFHRSNIYSNAPMPFMQRITWSGVALHEGESIGHRASHGCIRMPHDFAVRLYGLTRLGARVVIANPELKPVEFADPHLFVHKTPAPPAMAAVPAPVVKTAQTIDNGQTTDAVATTNPDAAVAADPAPPAIEQDPLVKPAAATETDTAKVRATDSSPVIPVDVSTDAVPVPSPKPPALAETAAALRGPITIFVSRKEKKLYVRQDFTPLFDAPITIAQPEQPFGTHVFTALDYLSDGATFRWNLVSLPGEPPKPVRNAAAEQRAERHIRGRRQDEVAEKKAADPVPSPAPEEVLARIEIPQDVIDRISELMVPGSSLVVSDQGLGDETGEGTDFVVVIR